MPNDPKSFLSTDGLQTLIANIKASLGTTDYDDLSDKPKLNNVTVQGNKTSTDFGLQDKIDSSHKLNSDLIDDSESINKFVTAAEKTAWNKSVSYMSIPNNGDLNDYYGAENTGNYLCTDANVATLSHKPSAITTAFRMDVIFYNDQTIQVIYPNDEKCVSFLRIYKNNTWSEWKESAIEMTILSYGNSTWDDFIKAYLLNSIVYCRAGSSTPQTSPQLRLAFMAYVNDEANPTEVEFQYYRSVSNKSDSAQGDEVYVYKLNKTSGWSNLKRNTYSKVAVASPITKSYASGTITLGHANSGVTAGTYDSVTVDAKGHVTAGSNYTIDSSPTENSQNLVTSSGVYTDQQRQQTETNAIANLGAKNFVKTTTFSFTTSTQIEVAPITGTVVLSAQNITSDDTSGSQCAVIFNYSDGTSSETMLINRGDNISVEKTFDKTVIGMTIYASRRESLSYDKTATFTNLMIRPAAITDDTFMPYAPTNRELYETKTEQVETNIIANLGAKNYCLKETETSTSSGSTELMGVNIPAGTYILSFTGTLAYSGSLSLYSAYSSSSSTYVGKVNFQAQAGTQSFEFKFKVYQTAKYMQFYHSGGGNSLTNIMIRPASIVDPTFVPYSRTNAELTKENDSQQPEIDYAVNTGVKNLLHFNEIAASSSNKGQVVSINGITFTIQPDKSITAYGTATNGAWIFFYHDDTTNNYIDLFDGNHIWTGLPTGTTSNEVAVFYKVDGGNSILIDPVSGILPQVTGSKVAFGIQVQKNQSYTQADPLVIKPMIRSTSITDPTFQPYADTNPVLTQEVNWNVNQGVKNLINLNPSTYTSGNVVVELNDDGTVSVSLSSGSTANTTFSRAIKTITNLRGMDLILNGCPSGGNYSSGYALYISDDSTTKEKDEGNGVLVPKDTTVTTSYLALIVRSGTAISGTLTFKPMIRPASITDSTFQPYALPNPTLTPAVIKAVDEGAKNLLRNTASSQVVGGVTFTVNADGTIIANGTKTNNDWLFLSTGNSLAAGTYVLSSGLAPQSDLSIRLLIATADSLGSAIMSAEGERQVHIKQLTSDYTGLYYAIRISSGTTVNNIVFKPMICTAADWAVSQKFVPYCPTNRELYEMIGNINTILQGVL